MLLPLLFLSDFNQNWNLSIYLFYVFFWVISRRLSFICRRFGTLYFFHPYRRVGIKMEQTERSEMSAYKIQTPGNHPQESIQHTAYSKQHSEHGESLKSRTVGIFS